MKRLFPILLGLCAILATLPYSHGQQTPFRQDRAKPRVRASAVITVQQISTGPDASEAIYDTASDQERQNDLLILRSDELLGKVVDDYEHTLFQFQDFRFMQRAQRIAYLRSSTDIEQTPNSPKITVTVTNQSGELAATLANAIVTRFKSYKRSSIADPTRIRIQALENGIKAISQGIEEIAKTIAPFSPLNAAQITDLKAPQISGEFLRTPSGCDALVQALIREFGRRNAFQDRRRTEENILRASDEVVTILQLAEPPVTGL